MYTKTNTDPITGAARMYNYRHGYDQVHQLQTGPWGASRGSTTLDIQPFVRNAVTKHYKYNGPTAARPPNIVKTMVWAPGVH